jgi:vitamin B12 transporter
MRPSLCFHTVALIAVLTVTSAAGQTPSSSVTPRFDTQVVVTAERVETPQSTVPAATVVLGQELLRTLPTVFLGETIAFLPGFQVMRGEFAAGRPVVSARGFFGGGEADYVLLLVDGVPAMDIESGLADWSVVPSSGIRRIEALRGPGASMYGDAAVGGVIQVLTNRQDPISQLSASAGSFNSFITDGVFGRRLQSVGFNVGGAVRTTDGFAAHSTARHYVGRASVDGRAGEETWRFSANGQRRENEDPGALLLAAARTTPTATDPIFGFDNAERTSFSTAFTLRGNGGGWMHQARAHAGGRSEDLVRTILLAPGLGDRRTRDLSAVAFGGSAEANREFGTGPGASRLHFGVDLSRERLTNAYAPVSSAGAIGTFAPDVEGHRLRGGGFVSGGWNPAGRVGVSAAVRWDRVGDSGFQLESTTERTHGAWSPRAGVTVRLNDRADITAFGQMSRAFKAPTLDQLFDARPYPDFRGGTFTISNSLLEPQRATNVEGGVFGGTTKVRWTALVYRMGVEQEIDFDVRTFRYQNIGESRHTGAEFEASGRAGLFQPSAGYALTKVVDTAAASDLQLKNIPRHTFSVGTGFDVPRVVSGNIRYRQTRGAFIDDSNLIAIEGPSALDLRLRHSFGRHAVFFDGLNLANDTYEEFGFTLTSFTGQTVPYAWPGATRSLRVGVQLEF